MLKTKAVGVACVYYCWSSPGRTANTWLIRIVLYAVCNLGNQFQSRWYTCQLASTKLSICTWERELYSSYLILWWTYMLCRAMSPHADLQFPYPAEPLAGRCGLPQMWNEMYTFFSIDKHDSLIDLIIYTWYIKAFLRKGTSNAPILQQHNVPIPQRDQRPGNVVT